MSSSFVITTDNTDKVLVEKNDAVMKAFKVIGIQAEKYAKKKCPVDTGRLRNSITNQYDGNSVEVGTNVEYAIYVEMGSRHGDTHIIGRPYIKPAIAEHIDEYKEIFERILENA